MKRIIVATVALCLTAGLGLISGCASDGGSAPAQAGVPAKASAYAAPPRDSEFAKVQMGSTDTAVRKLLGDPDESNAYMTGKSWIPFYFGPDTHRTDWMYTGQGRVVFSRSRWTGGLTVIDVLYNPNELQ